MRAVFMLPVLLKVAVPARAGIAVPAASPMVSRPANNVCCTFFDRCPFKKAISTSFTNDKQHGALPVFSRACLRLKPEESVIQSATFHACKMFCAQPKDRLRGV